MSEKKFEPIIAHTRVTPHLEYFDRYQNATQYPYAFPALNSDFNADLWRVNAEEVKNYIETLDTARDGKIWKFWRYT